MPRVVVPLLARTILSGLMAPQLLLVLHRVLKLQTGLPCTKSFEQGKCNLISVDTFGVSQGQLGNTGCAALVHLHLPYMLCYIFTLGGTRDTPDFEQLQHVNARFSALDASQWPHLNKKQVNPYQCWKSDQHRIASTAMSTRLTPVPQ